VNNLTRLTAYLWCVAPTERICWPSSMENLQHQLALTRVLHWRSLYSALHKVTQIIFKKALVL